jgi:ankyrin repeat protein
MVNFLLAHGADPNSISGYGTPAHWAAERGHLAIIQLLMDKGFNPRIEEMSYWVEKYKAGEQLTPSWMSKLVGKLLEKEIDYRNYPYMEFTNPSDPLLLGAAIVHDKSNKLVLAKELIKQGGNVNLVDKRGMTALLWAVHSLNTKAVAYLLKNGADANQALYSKLFSEITSKTFFDDNLTPLHFLFFQLKQRPEILKNKKAEVLKIVKLLIRNGADIKLKTKSKNQSVLDVAMEINNPQLVKLLQK